MAQKIHYIDGIGNVVLAKRKGARHIRLSITAKGDVRVSLPYWAPYEAGISFAKSRQDWIAKQVGGQTQALLREGHRIGKAHTLHFEPGAKLRGSVKNTEVIVTVPSGTSAYDDSVQATAKRSCERALKAEAEQLLPQRLIALARQYGFTYKSVNIKKLHSRWGSCSSEKEISLSYYLMQLPWHLIDYVLLHELSHTKYMHHQSSFWDLLGSLLPTVKERRKEIKRYRPMVIPA